MKNKKANIAVKENETIVKESFTVSDSELLKSLNDANVSNLIAKASSKKSSLYRFNELSYNKQELDLEKSKNLRQICRRLLKQLSANVVNNPAKENDILFLAYAYTFCISYDGTIKSLSNIKESPENKTEYDFIIKAIAQTNKTKLSEEMKKELRNKFSIFAKSFENYLIPIK